MWQSRVQISQQPIGKLVEAEISQQPVAESGASKIFQTVSEKFEAAKVRQQRVGRSDAIEISQQAIGESGALRKSQTPSDQFPTSEQPVRKPPFTISWTHYLVLLTIKDPDERSFYEIEATNAGWSVPELKRQKASCLYEEYEESSLFGVGNAGPPPPE